MSNTAITTGIIDLAVFSRALAIVSKTHGKYNIYDFQKYQNTFDAHKLIPILLQLLALFLFILK